VLTEKKIIVGVSGGIAAYKTPMLVRSLVKLGADVRILMTQDAARFVTPLTLAVVSGHEVLTDIFPHSSADSDLNWTQHITLGDWADLFVLAPATANTLAKLAHGFSNDMLSATALSLRPDKLKWLFPSMDEEMYRNAATQANLDVLRSRGYEIFTPDVGFLASGLHGIGRMPEPEHIAKLISERLTQKKILDGLNILITAGPTREKIDAVRFISNYSSGKMGFALAEVAARLGASVTLVTGKVHLDTPAGVTRVNVDSAKEMFEATMKHVAQANVIIAAAAVADYTPKEYSPVKIKKSDDAFSLPLVKTTDILKEIGSHHKSGKLLVGFALENDNELANAREKLTRKNLDLIVLNSMNNAGAGFETDTNAVTLLTPDGHAEAVATAPKSVIAEKILHCISELFATRLK